MQVWESAGPATLRFAAEDLYGADGASCGDGDAEGGSLLGAVAEDGPLVSALWDDILGRQGGDVGGGRMRVDFIGGATLRSIVAYWFLAVIFQKLIYLCWGSFIEWGKAFFIDGEL